jgi:hypothetical protein
MRVAISAFKLITLLSISAFVKGLPLAVAPTSLVIIVAIGVL